MCISLPVTETTWDTRFLTSSSINLSPATEYRCNLQPGVTQSWFPWQRTACYTAFLMLFVKWVEASRKGHISICSPTAEAHSLRREAQEIYKPALDTVFRYTDLSLFLYYLGLFLIIKNVLTTALMSKHLFFCKQH